MYWTQLKTSHWTSPQAGQRILAGYSHTHMQSSKYRDWS